MNSAILMPNKKFIFCEFFRDFFNYYLKLLTFYQIEKTHQLIIGN